MPSLLSRFAGRFPAHSGPHHVGTIDVELPVQDLPHNFETSTPDEEITTIAFRLYYPCAAPDASSKPQHPSWIPSPQDSHVKHFGRFLGLGDTMSSVFVHFPHLLSHIKLAALSNARPATPPPAQGSQWPMVVFSHGLAGNRTTYSHICSSLASHGLVVAAPEHRDGSCPVSFIAPTNSATDSSPSNGARPRAYRRISHTPSDAVFRARDEQLSVRLWELALLAEALEKINAGSALQNLRCPKETPEDALGWFRDSLDLTPGNVCFAGHSFGAATTAQLVKSAYWSTHHHPVLPISPVISATSADSREQTTLFEPTKEAAISSMITPTTPTILLDMWTLPLRSPFTSDLAALPMPHFVPENPNGGAPILAVMSSAFVGWEENMRTLKSALSDPYAQVQPSHSTLVPKHPSLAALLVHSDAVSATDSGYESETASAQGVLAPSAQEPPIVRAREKAHIFYPQRSAHLSQSDYGVLFPTLTRYVAKGSEPDRTVRLNVRAILETLRRSKIPVQGFKGKTPNDAAILSREPGTLRGWVFIDIDDKYATPTEDPTCAKRSDSVMDKVVDEVAPLQLTKTAEYGGKA